MGVRLFFRLKMLCSFEKEENQTKNFLDAVFFLYIYSDDFSLNEKHDGGS